MSQQLIKAGEYIKNELPAFKGESLRVSEFFCDTIQGEGIYTGHPAVFLRLQGCTLDCSWCDTKEVWRKGSAYNFHTLFTMMEKYDVITKLRDGTHLVITGGSPLLQQDNVLKFIHLFIDIYKFKPFIEVENEAVLMPRMDLIRVVDCWNNSPKLSNSGNTGLKTFKPSILRFMDGLENSWFKFVITSWEDWVYIKEMYISQGLISKEKVILMPQGLTKAEIMQNNTMVSDICIENGIKFSTRIHLILWDLKTGV